MDVFAQNLNWIRENEADHRTVSEGVIYGIAEHLKKQHSHLTPEMVRDTFSALCDFEYSTVYLALLCKYLWELDACLSDEIESAAPQKTVYLRSSVTDKAYDTFSKLYPGLKAAYAHDFKSVCEDAAFCSISVTSSQALEADGSIYESLIRSSSFSIFL